MKAKTIASAQRDPMIALRPATPDDAPLLQHWDEQPHVLASNPNDRWEWETELDRAVDWCTQWIAEVEGRPIGFVQILDAAREESHYWGDVPDGTMAIDIWIGEVAELGKGYGSEIMRDALSRCFDDPNTTRVLVDPLASNVRAHRFYERLGFRLLERRRFGADDCSVYVLSRTAWRASGRS